MKNKYVRLWLPIIGFHALHQLEESISFFRWYAEYAADMGKWAILNIKFANLAISNPTYFIFASIAQILFVSLMAFLFRNNENITKWLIVIYLIGLSYFMLWHIVSSYVVHSYAPIMVTSIGGLYLIPIWMYKLFKN